MSEKPIREYDRFIVRLPDGMRHRLAKRAKATGRSMNAEVVEILDRALSEPSMHDVFDLAKSGLKLKRELEEDAQAIKRKQHDLDLIRDEIRSLLAGEEIGDQDPTLYAVQIYFDRTAAARQKAASDLDPPSSGDL